MSRPSRVLSGKMILKREGECLPLSAGSQSQSREWMDGEIMLIDETEKKIVNVVHSSK
jgi:hypothetical protein